ncbi:MAG: hypothetical protein KIT87_26750, partial [Anaerolineae bacterium]|nr:hypothetical protein [Anaerolineae bacterium]
MRHRIRATSAVAWVLLLLSLGLLAACQPSAETASAPAQPNAATTPIPTVAPLPTISLPTSGQAGTGATGAGIGSRSYVGEVRVKQ